MPDLISNLASLMQRNIETLDAIAQNAANANTQGYKSVEESVAVQSFSQLLAGDSEISQSVSLLAGSVETTDRFTDVASLGDAWFTVQTPDGVAYTRQGNFSVDANGMLTTQSGYPVLGTDGELRVGSGMFSVNSLGAIDTADGARLTMALARPVDSAGVIAKGHGLYTGDFELLDTISNDNAANRYTLQQFALESSNVDVADDMVSLMSTTRHIESLQRAMSTYNELLNTGINQLGNR